MRTFLTLLLRELKSFFYSPIAYVVLFYFLLLMGFHSWELIAIMNGYPVETTVVQEFFKSAVFWFPFVLIFPLITMRVYSEEFRMGTIETLTTAPVQDWQIVLAKFLGTFLFSCLLFSPVLGFFAIFSKVSGTATATATGAYWTSYLLLSLMGLFYCAIGCLASALTKNQINAAMVSFTTITLLLFMGFIFDIAGVTSPAARELQGYISPINHMADFSKGIIDSRPIVFYLTMTTLVVFLTFQVFQFRKWKA